jgi:cytochrome bd-type quinol oxidase subunit 2
MNGFRLVGSLLAGVLAFAAVGVAVTAALDPYVWPSTLLGLPAGVIAGVATVPLVYLGLTARAERAADGRTSDRTRRRLRTTAAGTAGFLLGGGLAFVVLSTQVVGFATALLFGAFPVGLLVAAVAAYLVARRARRGGERSPPGPATD